MKEQRSWSYFSYHCYLFYVILIFIFTLIYQFVPLLLSFFLSFFLFSFLPFFNIFISTLIKKIEILKREFFLRKIVEKKNTFALLAN